MNEDILEAVLVVCAIIWIGYKFAKKRDSRLIYVMVIVAFLQLSFWPLYLPNKFSLSLISFFSAGMIVRYNKKKMKDPHAYFYALIFICFGVVFFAEAYFKYFHRT